MAKTNGASHKPKGAVDEETPESLDKVRDILFGGQMRAVESRLRAMEDRLGRDQQALRTDLSRQLADLDGALRKELASLTEKVAAEKAKRAEELKGLGQELKESLKALEKRHGRLEETTALSDAELRDHLLKQSAATSVEIGRLSERLGAELDRSVRELKAEKLDTTGMVGLLNEMATRLAGKGSKNGPRS